jgi:hypothetical protein
MWKICVSSFLKVSSFKVKVFESEINENFNFQIWESVREFFDLLKV